MSKHLQQKQIFDSFYNEENYSYLSGDEPCLEPNCMDEEQIYEHISEEEIPEYSMDELDLEDYDDFMQL